MITITSVACDFRVGDIVSMELPLTKWERFLIWLVRPWKWPSRTYRASRIITAVCSSSTSEAEWA